MLSQQLFALSNNVYDVYDLPNGLSPPCVDNLSIVEQTNSWKDVIINEVFPDPSPSVGLPATEYVELLNRSGHDINLLSFELHDKSTFIRLPDLVLHTGEYIIITESPDLFKNSGNVWGSKDFPSLNNDEDVLSLRDSVGFVIDSLHYYSAWFNSEERNGGWSLELIDPSNTCSAKGNWEGSENATGGTPGFQNSVFAEKPDLIGPTLLSVVPKDDRSLVIRFDEPLAMHIPPFSCFQFEPTLSIEKVLFSDGTFQRIEIHLNQSLLMQVTYKIMVSDIPDCAGNITVATDNTLTFGKVETAHTGDVVINEILFNPRPGGVDFVELFNASTKFINLKNWSLGNIDAGAIGDSHEIVEGDFLFRPGDYLVATEDVTLLVSDYPNSVEAYVTEVVKLPKLNDDEGTIALSDNADSLIDALNYSARMHSIFLKDPEGVSLERISAVNSSSDIHNWQSSSSISGFATPGFVNSNAVAQIGGYNDMVKVEPRAFVPLYGQPSFTQISYTFDHGGNVANVTIYDERGRVIKHLATNELLGTSGALRWDGDRDDGYKARIGCYLIHFEVFDSSGAVRSYKEAIAVAARF